MLDFFACERGLRNIQKLRCLTRRALFFERVGNQLFFLLIHDLVEIKAFFAAHLAFEVDHAFIIYVDIQKLIHRVLTDLPLALADVKTMHCIFQLSDIAGPVIFLQLLISLRREGFLNAVLQAVMVDEGRGQTLDILRTFPQRRHVNTADIQTIIQVLSELAFVD